MPFGFDPRKLVKEKEEQEKKNEEEVVWEAIAKDIDAEEKEKALRKKSSIQRSLDKAEQAIRESKYMQKHGIATWAKKKKELDPTFAFPSERRKNKTLAEEYEDKPIIDVEKNKIEMAGTTGPLDIEWESTGTSSNPFQSEVGLSESIAGAILSGTIKIPYGWVNLTAMIADWAGEKGIPVDQSNVAKLERWFDQTYLGGAMRFGEEKARASAIGKFTEALVQIYGNWKAVGKHVVNLSDDAFKMYNKAMGGVKAGKYVRTAKNNNIYEAAKATQKANKLSFGQQFVGLTVGGGVAGALVYDKEDIGTFGDWFFDEGENWALDRKKRGTAKEDAARQLYNTLKFGAEMGFPIIPSIVGVGRLGKLLKNQDANLAYSSERVHRLVDRFLAKPLRSRGPFPEDQFQAMQRLHGKESSSRLLTEDYLKNFDQIIKRISKNSQGAANASGLADDISQVIVDTIKKGKLGVNKQGKVVVQGFGSKDLNKLMKTLTKDLKVAEKDALALIDELVNVHGNWAEFLNAVVKGGNLNVATKEFVGIMTERIQNTLTTQYKIFKDNGVKAIDEFAPAKDVRDEVRDIFVRNAADNDVRLSKSQATEIVNDVIKNVELNPETATPIFRYDLPGWNQEKLRGTKNIAENITGGGKFKADKKGGLIQTEKDLTAFKRLFGNYEKAENVIANVTTDLASIAARDRYYNKILQDSKAAIKQGKRGMVYDTPAEARAAFNTNMPGSTEKIIETPLNLPQALGGEAYTVPLNGKFTTQNIADGLTHAADISLSKKVMPMWYQIAVMIPKGMVQAGKTVFGPFTHTRNFASGAVTTISTGNIFINPMQMAKAFRTAMNTIQPQILYKNKPGVKVNVDTSTPGKFRPGANTTDPNKLIGAQEFTEGGGQSLYRFLLDEGMVNQSATYRELMGLIEDTQKSNFFNWVTSKMHRKLRAFGKKAQDLYVAEDDFWKIWNFAAESHRIRRSYANAIKAGKIKLKDVPGGSLDSVDILKMATNNVRLMLPNYAYVSRLIKSTRRSPLGNFVSWPSEILRGSTNQFNQAVKETKNPIFARMGWERLLGSATAWATIPPLAVWGFSQAYGFTREKLSALREFIPWFSADSTILPVYVDGQYKYVDFSRGYFYDTIVNPAQALINEVTANPDQPLIPSLIDGFGKATHRLVEPFVSEAIWVGGLADLFMRGGETRHGVRVFSERDSFGVQMQKGVMHLAKTFSPGSRVQVERLYAAVMGKTHKGVQYEVPDELLGMVGARPAPLDLRKTMNIFIGEYLKKNERLERNLAYENLRTGDPVDPKDIIKQFNYANQQKYESMSEIRRKIDALKVLGWSDEKLRELFDRRGKLNAYDSIMSNEFVPFKLTKKTIESFDRLVEDQAEKGLSFKNPFDERMIEKINSMRELMEGRPLNRDWTLDAKDFYYPDPKKKDEAPLPAEEGMIWEKTSLPPTSMPKVAQIPPQINPQTGLTRTESALLSPEEQVIARRT
jgi:hypothetical protein